MYLQDEKLFIKSIDSKSILTWDDFQYILSVLVENRILKVFVAWQVKTQTEVDLTEQIKKPKRKKQKKRQIKVKEFSVESTEELEPH